MSNPSTLSIFATCAPGLEPLLAEELRPVTGEKSRVLEGGIEWRGPLWNLHWVSLRSRLTESLRIRLKAFTAREFPQLEKGLRTLPFRAYLPQKSWVRVQVVCHKSKLWHSGAVQQRVEKVLTDYVGWRISTEERAQLLHVRIQDDEVQISLDAGGQKMHRRGYRPNTEKASLRETLGAALFTSAWSLRKESEAPPVIWDPFCGAGTILLEGAHRLSGQLPGSARQFAFEKWRGHEKASFAQFKQEALAEAQAAACPSISFIGSDISEKALEACRENSKLASVESVTEWRHGDVEEVAASIPKGATVVSNPPYGKRLAEAQGVVQLMRVLKARPDLEPAVALLGGAARDAIPKSCPALFRTKNGGLPVSARHLTP